MNDLHFDNLTRRASLTPLGGGGLVALASPVRAAAKGNKSKNRKGSSAKKRCMTQVAQCTDFSTAACAGDPACAATFQPCCSPAGQCDFTGFITCLQQAVNS